MSALRDWAFARMAESSTVIGLVSAGCTIGGIVVAPAYAAAIATIAGLIASAGLVVTKEAPKAPAP